ncbi:GNAT family N-acetyltransferase [Govanella unica]|uniref:GNAT family N-acetyltransferase n=1 Tax=Govanella unica TaxID=2975056 RepID=A0A9X3TVG3_9PROT|nr:GNAT family N-acetyltransferase [Govania unica]MDA5192568.1 GNAT family N-acetyltransferase [Govania unica]
MSEFQAIPPGKLAAVVTHFDMRDLPPVDAAGLERPDLHLEFVADPDLDWYRDLFRAVGARWLWFSRLRMTDEALGAIIKDPAVEIYALTRQGETTPKGLLELDFRDPKNAELAFLGVTADMIGSGAGRYLMARAMERFRAVKPPRVFVHTCTNDHPDAPKFYERAGFRACGREVEIMTDPRLDGTLPRDVAPHVPLI